MLRLRVYSVKFWLHEAGDFSYHWGVSRLFALETFGVSWLSQVWIPWPDCCRHGLFFLGGDIAFVVTCCSWISASVWLYGGLFFLSGLPSLGKWFVNPALRACWRELANSPALLWIPQACEGRQMARLSSEPPLYVMMKNDQPPGKWKSGPRQLRILVNDFEINPKWRKKSFFKLIVCLKGLLHVCSPKWMLYLDCWA